MEQRDFIPKNLNDPALEWKKSCYQHGFLHYTDCIKWLIYLLGLVLLPKIEGNTQRSWPYLATKLVKDVSGETIIKR
jgi:hypothetical protein